MKRDSITKKQLREFGFVLGFGFPLIIGFIIPAIGSNPFKNWTLFVGIPFLIISLIKTSLLFYPYKYWMALGQILGWVNSRIILGSIFIIVLQPIALIMRIFGYDPLKKRKKIYQKTYRENKKDYKIDLTRIF